jgi:hypothetical protein
VYVNKTLCHTGGRLAGKKDLNVGQANSTGGPPDHISKQSGVTNLANSTAWHHIFDKVTLLKRYNKRLIVHLNRVYY